MYCFFYRLLDYSFTATGVAYSDVGFLQVNLEAVFYLTLGDDCSTSSCERVLEVNLKRSFNLPYLRLFYDLIKGLKLDLSDSACDIGAVF